MTSDEQLARRASRGDRHAFAAIYERYHQQLYRFCFSILGNSEDAHDALQSVMLKALDALSGEQRQIQVKAWLYRIARNESIDMLRRRRVEPEIDMETLGGGDAADVATERVRLRQLLADLAELPERQRSALTMRELGGLEFSQIGEAFGTSGAAARQTVYEARLSLRQLEAGREMSCESVTRKLSEADGRVTRRREIQAHLRDCAECRQFGESITSRKQDLAAISPLPPVASAALLQTLLGSSQAAVGGGLATAVGAGAGKAAATSVVAKSVATVVVVAAIGVAAGDQAGMIDVGGSQPGTPGQEVQTAAPADPPAEVVTNSATGPQEEPQTTASRQRADLAAGQSPGSQPPGDASLGALPPAPEQPGRDAPGTPEELPAASSHGQQTAAAHGGGRANAPGRSHDHKQGQAGTGKQGGEQGGSKAKKQKPSPSKPSAAPGSGTPPSHAKAKQPPSKGLGPDNSPGPPLQQSEPPDKPGVPAEAGAPPSKEAR